MTEPARIADQLRRAMSGESWTGVCVNEVLADVTAEQAAAHPLANAHSIWELVLHIEVYLGGAYQALEGKPMPKIYRTPEDWRAPGETSAAAWKQAVAELQATAAALADAMERFDAARFEVVVRNREYDHYHLLHGVVQHTLYHLGQIVMVKKALNA